MCIGGGCEGWPTDQGYQICYSGNWNALASLILGGCDSSNGAICFGGPTTTVLTSDSLPILHHSQNVCCAATAVSSVIAAGYVSPYLLHA